MTRLHAVLNLFRYDTRRLLGLLAALRRDPMAAVAGAGVLLVIGGGAGWALAGRWSELPPAATPGLGLALGAGLALSLKPLPGLRAGPLRELADERAAVWAWLWLRALTVLTLALLIVGVAAAGMGWRPDAPFAIAFAAVAAGAAGASAVALFPLRLSFRLPALPLAPGVAPPRFRSRAARLAWIDLARPLSGLPVGIWAALLWAGALLIRPHDPEPRLIMVADAAAFGLTFLATVLILRFDAATARLLTFEPGSFFRLVRDILGVRLLGVAAAAGLIALAATPVALAGAALGAGYRSLELLHGVRRPAAAARLLAQLETALVLGIGLVVGPAALVWLVIRSGWLYRRAGRSMGLA